MSESERYRVRVAFLEEQHTEAVFVLRELVVAAKEDLCCPGDDGWGTCSTECAVALERYSALSEALDVVGTQPAPDEPLSCQNCDSPNAVTITVCRGCAFLIKGES